MRLLFVRHAESIGNVEGRLQGRAEFALSEQGRAQAERLYARFQQEGFAPTHVYSSPQRRIAETVEIVARQWPVPVVYWDDLKEHDIGIFTGLTWEEISARHPDAAAAYHTSRDWDAVKGAESLRQRRERALRVVQTVIQRHSNADAVALFTHGGFLQNMVSALMGAQRTWGVPVKNTAVFDFSVDVDRWPLDGDGLFNTFLWQIKHFNDASHLG